MAPLETKALSLERASAQPLAVTSIPWMGGQTGAALSVGRGCLLPRLSENPSSWLGLPSLLPAALYNKDDEMCDE